MSRRPLLRLATVAALCGLLLALALALVLPRSSAAPSAADPRHPASGPPRARDMAEMSGYAQARVLGAARVVARMRDPLGGPDWAVRLVRQRYQGPGAHGRLGPVGPPLWCAQLGRMLDGRFGWVDGGNVFRPVRPGFDGAPQQCVRRLAEAARRPQLDVLARVGGLRSAPAPRLLQQVAWGLVAPRSDARLRVDGRALTPARSQGGAFVAPFPATRRQPEVRLTVNRAGGGGSAVATSSFRAHAELFRGFQERARRALPHGRARIPAPPVLPLPRAGVAPLVDDRALDPSGGLPWGHAVAPSEAGGWCVSALGRVVGQRVGLVDAALGTFADAGPDPNLGCSGAGSAPTRARPLAIVTSYTSLGDGRPGGAPPADRVARRTLPGRTTIEGVALASVRTITIATPRDVRTILPSPRAHAFGVVYDGLFPTGSARVTATLADGSAYRTSVPLGAP